jgi:hypothetical protein
MIWKVRAASKLLISRRFSVDRVLAHYGGPGLDKIMEGKMHRIAFVTVMSILLIGFEAEAREVAGVEIPETLKLENSELLLNGAGIRTKLFMDMYVGGLYLTKKNAEAKAITEADEAMAIKLHITSFLITSERMKEATNEGFELSLKGKTAPLREEIDAFIAVFEEEIVENDIFDLIYVPGTGMKISKNGTYKATIAGHDFKQALFGIWLSDSPVQKSLRQEMLGR